MVTFYDETGPRGASFCIHLVNDGAVLYLLCEHATCFYIYIYMFSFVVLWGKLYV